MAYSYGQYGEGHQAEPRGESQLLLRFKTPFLIGLAALLGLAPVMLIPATASAVTISLVQIACLPLRSARP